MGINKNIADLNSQGQSIWYDNLSRDVLNSGELKRLIESGVSGLTSNPTIFKKAIADSKDYDKSIIQLKADFSDADSLCEALMIEDVAAASDLLRPTFERTKGADGYASIEVSPFLARDAKATVEAAKRIWGKLDRPNIMIKIPATEECLPAIRETLQAGINVNVTLIFSCDFYAKVVEQYLAALESRVAKGQSIKEIASVASFFVSRVDAICERELDEGIKVGKLNESDKQALLGKIGVANSKLAYEHYEKIFKGARFDKLKQSGARVQRPLWASTGTKNPALKPTLYVEELAGRDTVNTVPPATLEALMKNADVSDCLHRGLKEAHDLVSSLKSKGLDFEKLMVELQVDGVKLFSDAYRDLLAAVEKKSQALT